MTLKAAFIFLAPEADPQQHRATVVTPQVELTAVAARDYAEAEQVAQMLVSEGVEAIELCGGFGNKGTGRKPIYGYEKVCCSDSHFCYSNRMPTGVCSTSRCR